MGQKIAGAAGTATVRVDARAPAGSTLEIVDGDVVIASTRMPEPVSGAPPYEFRIELAPGLHPIRAQVRGPDGRLRLLSNAVLVESKP